MDMKTYQFQSAFARRYHSKGIAVGKKEGIAALVTRQLEKRFGLLTLEVRNGIEAASVADLDAIGERLLTAATVEDALDANVRT
jgi:urease gamma subunit